MRLLSSIVLVVLMALVVLGIAEVVYASCEYIFINGYVCAVCTWGNIVTINCW